MSPRRQPRFRLQWPLVMLGLAAQAGCAPESSDDSDPTLESLGQAETLTQSEQADVQSFVNDLKNNSPKLRIEPILNCVEKIKEGRYIAHFGYNNTSAGTVTINVGSLNRFFPAPSNRGQPTKFSKGVKNDAFKVPFDGSLMVWGVDGNPAVAHRTSRPCAVPPPPTCKVDCDDKNPCTADICDAGTKFACTHKNLTAGTSCGDGRACNGFEVCDGKGVCKAGTALNCDDNNPCTIESCDERVGCRHVPVLEPKTCPVPGNCGAGGQCEAGVCKPVAASCDDNNPCTTDSCPGGTTCSHIAVAAGTACSDDNACNGSESCDENAVCKAGPAPDCDDQNACTVDSCGTAGGCGHVAGNDGSQCRDGSGKSGICNGGICNIDPGPPLHD